VIGSISLGIVLLENPYLLNIYRVVFLYNVEHPHGAKCIDRVLRGG